MKKVEKKLSGVSVAAPEMTAAADLAIKGYQKYVEKETGGTISRSRAIVAILERSEYATAAAENIG